jgi:hypothetical protein
MPAAVMWQRSLLRQQQLQPQPHARRSHRLLPQQQQQQQLLVTAML